MGVVSINLHGEFNVLYVLLATFPKKQSQRHQNLPKYSQRVLLHVAFSALLPVSLMCSVQSQLCIRVLFCTYASLGVVVLFRGDILSHCVDSLLPVTGTNLLRLSLTKWHIIYVFCVFVWRLSNQMEGNVNLHGRAAFGTGSFFSFFNCLCFFVLCASGIVHILLWCPCGWTGPWLIYIPVCEKCCFQETQTWVTLCHVLHHLGIKDCSH